ncbi:MAG: hypothetical protein LIO56_01310 [Lachnospiraceae bacterium]|nr:hypothetical protein [Clostridiales bacterium]MCC8141165.1 hypothetical protein [Lachnospiraceae bacterium]
MIDIHCHLLYGVDDGPNTIEESKAMLQEAAQQGVDTVILTPHFRQGMFPYDPDTIRKHFSELLPLASDVGVRLFLGTEYHIDRECVENLKNGRCLSLAGSEYVLAEYSHIEDYPFLKETVQELEFAGYVPVIAHAERCACLTEDPDLVDELQRSNVLIQLNADAVLGKTGRTEKQFCKYLLDCGMADIIASDSHDLTHRPCRMEKCRDYVRKRYGEAAAERMFEKTPGQIVK